MNAPLGSAELTDRVLSPGLPTRPRRHKHPNGGGACAAGGEAPPGATRPRLLVNSAEPEPLRDARPPESSLRQSAHILDSAVRPE